MTTPEYMENAPYLQKVLDYEVNCIFIRRVRTCITSWDKYVLVWFGNGPHAHYLNVHRHTRGSCWLANGLIGMSLVSR